MYHICFKMIMRIFFILTCLVWQVQSLKLDDCKYYHPSLRTWRDVDRVKCSSYNCDYTDCSSYDCRYHVRDARDPWFYTCIVTIISTVVFAAAFIFTCIRYINMKRALQLLSVEHSLDYTKRMKRTIKL